MKVVPAGTYRDSHPGDDGRRTLWRMFDVSAMKVRVNVSTKIGTHYCMNCNNEECVHANAVRRYLAKQKERR